MALLLEKHNISTPASARKDDSEEEDEEYQRKGHALKAFFSSTHVFLIDSGASNHMVASKESFSSLQSFMVLVFRWEITVKFKPKGRALSSLNMESSNMCFMFPP